VATHFSRLLRHAWVTVGLFLFPGHHTGNKIRNTCRNLIGKPEQKRPLGRPRCRREANVGIDLREIGWEGVEWIHLAQDTKEWPVLINIVVNFRVP
jgi:hypothetical protein